MSKNFLKIVATSLVVSMVIIVGARAAGGNVLTLEAEQDETTGEITFSGTTDQGVMAVSCILTSTSGSEIGFKSTSVDSATFSDSLTAPAGSYVLKCANYDQGDWVSALINIEEGEETEATPIPDTGRFTAEEASASEDNSSAIIAIVAVVGITLVVGTFVLKRRNIKK